MSHVYAILQGLVSLSPRNPSTSQCDPFKFTIFTKINLYLNWIQDEITKLHGRHGVF